MNERVSRAGGCGTAQFIQGFQADENDKRFNKGPQSENGEPPLWLAWLFEGKDTVSSLMQSNTFPDNAERLLFGRALENAERGPVRKGTVIAVILRHIL